MNCESCKTSIPYIVHEGAMSRMERTIKRLWILLILLVLLLIGTNIGWLIYESQFEDIVITADQSAETGNNYAIGGDMYGNEAESHN